VAPEGKKKVNQEKKEVHPIIKGLFKREVPPLIRTFRSKGKIDQGHYIFSEAGTLGELGTIYPMAKFRETTEKLCTWSEVIKKLC